VLNLYNDKLGDCKAVILLSGFTNYQTYNAQTIKDHWFKDFSGNAFKENQETQAPLPVRIAQASKEPLTIYGKEYYEFFAETRTIYGQDSEERTQTVCFYARSSTKQGGCTWALTPAARTWLKENLEAWILEEARSNYELLLHLALVDQHRKNVTHTQEKLREAEKERSKWLEVVAWAEAQTFSPPL